MPVEVELPDGVIAEFPDEMHPDEIKSVLRKKFPVQRAEAPAPVRTPLDDRAILGDYLNQTTPPQAPDIRARPGMDRDVIGIAGEDVPTAFNGESVPQILSKFGHEVAGRPLELAGKAVVGALNSPTTIQNFIEQDLMGSETPPLQPLYEYGKPLLDLKPEFTPEELDSMTPWQRRVVGATESVAGAASALTTPENIALLPAFGSAKVVKPLATYLLGLVGLQEPAAIEVAIEKAQDPNATPEEAAAAFTDAAVVNPVFAALLGKQAKGPGGKKAAIDALVDELKKEPSVNPKQPEAKRQLGVRLDQGENVLGTPELAALADRALQQGPNPPLARGDVSALERIRQELNPPPRLELTEPTRAIEARGREAGESVPRPTLEGVKVEPGFERTASDMLQERDRTGALEGRPEFSPVERATLDAFIAEEAAAGRKYPAPPYRQPRTPDARTGTRARERADLEAGLTQESGGYLDEPFQSTLPEPAPAPPPPGTTLMNPATGRSIVKPTVLSNLQRQRLQKALERGADEQVLRNIMRVKEPPSGEALSVAAPERATTESVVEMSPEQYFETSQQWARDSMAGKGEPVQIQAELAALRDPNIQKWKDGYAKASQEAAAIRAEVQSNPQSMGDPAVQKRFGGAAQKAQFFSEGLKVLEGTEPNARTKAALEKEQALSAGKEFHDLGPAESKFPHSEVLSEIENFRKDFPNSPKINVAKDYAGMPDASHQAAYRVGSDPRLIKAYVGKDGVWINADAVRTKSEARGLAFHEVGSHIFAEGKLGPKRLKRFMDQVHDTWTNSETMKVVKQSYPAADKTTLGREFVARVFENPTLAPNVFKRLVAQVRQLLRDFGWVKEVSENDIQSLMAGAMDAMRKVERGEATGDGMLSLKGTAWEGGAYNDAISSELLKSVQRKTISMEEYISLKDGKMEWPTDKLGSMERYQEAALRNAGVRFRKKITSGDSLSLKSAAEKANERFPVEGTTFERETGKPTTAMGYRPDVKPMDYIPETEAARVTEAQRIISTFGDDLGGAVRALARPAEMSGIPVSVRVVAGEQIARQAAANERAATNLADADKWADIRRDAHQLAQSELSQAGQALQSGAQLKRGYAESGAGIVERAEAEFKALKDLDKNFPDLSRETKQKIYDLAEQSEALGKLTEAEKAGKTPEQIAELERQKDAFTSRERLRLKTQIEVELAREKLKNGWRGWLTPEGRKARARTMNEIITANLLTTPTFLTKQPLDVASQYAYHVATRALAQVINLPRSGSLGERANQFMADAGHEVISSLKDVVNSRQAALRYGLEGAKGRGSHFRNTLGFGNDMKFLERAEQDIATAIKEKKPWKAVWPLYLSTIKIGLREAKFLDELSGTLVENVEIRQQVEKGLRDAGANPKEARTQARETVGNLLAEYALAEKQAQLFISGSKIKVPPSEFKAMVWDLAHQNMLERVRSLNMDAGAIESGSVSTARTFAWNQREIGSGPGGAMLGKPLESIKQYLESVGVPSPFTAFANAISIGSNRALTHAGLGMFPKLFKGSPFFETPKDITQRKVEAAMGLGVATLFATLAFNGNIRVRNQLSTNPDEKEKQLAEGRKGSTVEINVGGGKFIPISMNTGPLSPFRVQLSAIGALQDMQDRKSKREEKAKKEADKKELTLSGPVEDSEDLTAILLGAAASGAFGGRTLGGLQQSFAAPGEGIDWKRPLTSAATAMVPLMPAVKSTERISGVDIDSKRASLMSMILPSAISGAGEKSPRLNDWGEPLNEQSAARVIGILTGGTVPFPIGDISDPVKRLAIESGWSPPTFANRLFELEGEKLGKLSSEQRNRYLRRRGLLLKSAISDIIKKNPGSETKWSSDDWQEEFKGEFLDADDKALEEIGAVK